MAGSGQRSFAAKLNKGQHAADIRRQVSSHYSSGRELSRGASVSSGSLGPGSIPLSDVIEPLDFEEYIHQNIGQLNRDPLRQLLEFPHDDLDVKTIPRQFRTVKPSLPEPEAENNIQVRDCLHAYTCDWSVVERHYLPCVTRHEMSQHKEKQGDLSKQAQMYEVDELDVEDEFSLSDADSFKRSSIRMSDGTPRSSWASSIFDLKNSEMDDLLPNLLEHIPIEKQDDINTDIRRSNRNHHIFNLYPPLDENDAIERRSVASIPQDHFGYRLMIKCLTLKLELEVEPIFASMALYDVREKKKISENFYFDLNTENIKSMLKPHLGYPDVSSLARSALFSITYPSSDVYIVIKLEKVLQQGDITECAEPYMKEGDNSKHVEKVKAGAKYCCERLGAYRMPFAWTAVHLMHIINGASSLDRNSDGDLEKRASSLDLGRKGSAKEGSTYGSLPRKNLEVSGSGTLKRNGSERRSFYRVEEDMSHLQTFHPVTITVSSFFKQESDKLTDEDLFKFLADLKRPTSVLKRLKCIPGSLKLDISPMPENPPYCLTPDLQQVEPYPDLRTRPTREIQEFPSRDVYMPHNTYLNTLYVYPKCLNFSNRAGSARNIAVKLQFMAGENPETALQIIDWYQSDIHGSARNIAVKLQFMTGEDPATALQCIMGKSSCPEFSRQAYTGVTYHNRSPDFYEEFKIKLPADLDDRHHMLFTFYHISCQKKQEAKDIPVETPIGYTWLPCLKDGRLVTGDLHLPVSMDMPPTGYSMLSPEVQLPTMKWVDGHKPLFSIDIRAVSSIHAQDKHIDRFLSLCHSIEEGKIPRLIGEQNMESDLIRSTIELPQSVAEPLVEFLHIILNKLLLMMTHPPIVAGHLVNMGQVSFETIAQIVDRIHSLLDNAADQHGRNSLLSSYIQYVFRTLHGDEDTSTASTPTSLSPGSYGTVTRSTSLSIKQQFGHMRNASSASLQTATSPDDEVDGILHRGFGSERNNSKQNSQNRLSNTGMGNVPVQGLGGRVPPKKVLHEEIALQLVVCNGKAKEMALNHAWFFMELMVKSMAQYLAEKGSYGSPRRVRFPESFCNDIASIVNLVVHDIVARYNKDVRQMQLLNASLAFFLQDLFALMDRGFVLNLIRIYCKQVSGKITALADPTTLAQLKLDFLRIVSSHEHYVTLNLPFLPPSMSQPPSPTPSIQSITSYSSFVSTWTTVGEQNKMTELSTEYRQQHYLTALVLGDLANVLQTHNSSLHRQAIDMVCNLLASHDADERFTDPDCRMRVASLYVPLLSIVMDALPQLNCSNADPKHKPSAAMGDDNAADMPLQQSVAMQIAGSSVFASSDSRVESATVQARQPSHTHLTEQSTCDLLMCFLWIVKNMDPRVLQSWWGSLPSNRITHLLDVFFYAVCAFEYKGKHAIVKKQSRMSLKKYDVKQRLEEVIMGTSSARSDMIQRHSRQGSLTDKNFNPALGQAEKLRWRKDQTHWKQNIETPTERPRYELEQEAHLEGHLATEVVMVVVDALELLVGTISAADHLQGSLTGCMGVLLHALACNQSITVLQNVLATQRSLVFKYPELLFEEETEQCADLCLRLLHHCSSCISVVRSHASASLYLLMRQNFEIGNNFARVKMQVTMSLSSLVGTETNFHEEFLRRSLKTILTYAEEDVELQETSFPEQVRDLVFNLHMILSDTVKMKEFQEDPEMLLDLMFRIAKGYQNSPDLRLTWLQNMAGKHTENKNYTEAAQCLVHAAALVAEYLHMLEDRPHLPVGCVTFGRITPNVLEESAVSDDVVSPDEEGICTGKYFTESGLVGLLELAAASFNQAGKYEIMNEVYHILIPIHEANREYKKLSIIHSKLHEAFDRIVRQGMRRLFGTYFRVGFYGAKFGDLDGAEFVYKEPAITKLPEIAHRLENFYADRFGQELVEVIKDSNTVNRDKQDPIKAYIQVTYVEPYFDYHELLQRPTYFDRNYNIRRFMFATPFTKDGRAHGDLKEQYKRKTIITTSHAFPYIKTRVNVIDKSEIVLTPVQVAVEDIQKKTKELEVATLTEPPDAKMLQMVLQGCIGTTVNQGPMEVALVFLNDRSDSPKPLDKYQNKLRLCFKDFSKKCGDALRKNKNLITPDQREYQRELERNYHRFTDRLMPLISNRSRMGNAGSSGTLKRGSSSKMMVRKDSSQSIKTSETL